MPALQDRIMENIDGYEPAPQSAIPIPSPQHITPNVGNLMSGGSGNVVPMRGILPIEQMTDTDIHRFFPYSAYADRIPKFTYYSLLTQSKTK